MTFKDLTKLWEKYKEKYRDDAYRHVSQLMAEAKEIHRKDFLESPTPMGDHGQSWRPFKGKNLEKLIIHIIKDEVDSMGLKTVNGNKLEKTKSENLPKELSTVKRNLLIDYGEFGFHFPDLDIIIYEPQTCKVAAIISCKITLRERIAQTAYWKLKLASDPATMHIRGWFVTTDEDGDLVRGLDEASKKGAVRNRIIVEHDLDGTYTLRQASESDKVKSFPKLIDDLRRLANG